jgi:16S rRNA (uracil1498-N3)-methyltransferase
MKPRFFVETISAGALNAGQIHHITNVLRLRAGDTLTLCDGKGMEADAEITGKTNHSEFLTVYETVQNQSEPALSVSLFAAVSKGERMDYTVQKAVELGVVSIIPFLSSRCVAKTGKTARWRKIAESAAAQAGRGMIPAIEEPVPFYEAVLKAAQFPLALFCYELNTELSLRQALHGTVPASAAVMTGPEGGFTSDEAKIAAEKLTAVSLGPRILRCETAPVAVLSSLLFWSGGLE